MKDRQHIRITVFPESPKTRVIQRDKDAYDIFVTAPASDGRANRQATKVLRDSLQINGRIRIVTGHKSPNKIIEVRG